MVAGDSPAGGASRPEHKARIEAAYFLLLLVLASLGGWLIWLSTTNGVGLAIDSFDYFSAADAVAAGRGIGRLTGVGAFRPMTHFPPLFSITLATLKWTGLGAIRGARWLNIALFGGTIFVSGCVLWFMTHSLAFSLLGAALIMTSETLIDLHVWALSDPLYLFLGLTGLVGLATYIAAPSRRFLLFVSSALLAAAYLTRYVGISLVVGALAALAFLRRSPWKNRLNETGLFLATAMLPMSAWVARNLFLTGSPVDRPPPAWHPPSLERLYQGSTTVLNWVLPDVLVERLHGVPQLAAAGVLIASGAMLVAWYLRVTRVPKVTPQSQGAVLTRTLVFHAVAYLAALSISVLALDRITPLDGRILSPFQLIGLILGTGALAFVWSTKKGAAVRLAVATVALLFLGFQIYRAVGSIRRLHQEGQGYASNAWRNSPTIEFVRQLDDVPIYTNDLPALYFLTGRISNYIPTNYNPAADEERADYRDWLRTMHAQLKAEHGVLVIFGGEPLPVDPGQLADLTQGLVLTERFADGAVFAPAGND